MIYEELIYTDSNGRSVVMGVGEIYHVNVGKDVTGLYEFETKIYTSYGMNQYGSTVTGQRVEEREIQISGKINTKGDKAKDREARRELATVINPCNSGTLTYRYGTHVRSIAVKAESSPTFKSGVYTEFTATLIAHRPFWTDSVATETDIATWESLWEFPIEIPDTDGGMEFETRNASMIVEVNNNGDVRNGMIVKFKASGTVVNPTLICADTGEYIKVNHTMQAGETITVNTTYGNKSVMISDAVSETDIISDLDIDSTFIQLEAGSNTFKYDADVGVTALETIVVCEHLYIGA
jgi:hypothetical protein